MNRKLLVLGVVSTIAAPSAFAQANDDFFARDRYTAVTDRPQPEFDAVPLRLGTFTFEPAVTVGVSTDSNVLASGVREVDDLIFVVKPEFSLNSDWGRNFLGVNFTATNREYQDVSADSGADIETAVRGRLDVTRDFTLDAEARSGSFLEPRVAFAALEGAAEPVHFDRTSAQIGAQYRRSRILLRGDVTVTDANYDAVAAIGGGSFSQDFRDTTDTAYQGQVSYATSPSVAVFLRTTFTDRNGSGVGGFNRDTQATNVQVGTNFELATLVRGDIAVGVLQEDRADPRLSDFDGFSANARVLWFPSQLATVTFRAERASFDPGFFNTSTAFNTQLGAHVDYELRRNVLVFGDVARFDVDYQTNVDFLGNPFTRKDERWETSAGVAYKLNRNARIEAGVSYLDQTANGAPAADTYDRTIFSIGLKVNP